MVVEAAEEVGAGVERAVPAWGVEAEVVAVLPQLERVPVVAGQSLEGPWAARPWPRSPVPIARGPALRAEARRAEVAPQSGAPSGPVVRSFSAAAVGAGVAEVE